MGRLPVKSTLVAAQFFVDAVHRVETAPTSHLNFGKYFWFQNSWKHSFQISLSSTIAYLPYRMVIWILTSFLDLDYPFLDISALEDVYINLVS